VSVRVYIVPYNVSVGDKDVKCVIVDQRSVISPPLYIRLRVGVHVTRYIMSSAGPDVRSPSMVRRKTRFI